MYGAIPNFSQIGQTIWNVRVEIHLRLSVKCVTDSIFTKLRPPPHFFFVEKLPYRISWKSIELGRRWRNGLGLHRTFSFLSHNEILIVTQINSVFIYLLILWPKGHTGQSRCKAVGICGAAWGPAVRETPIWVVGFANLCQTWSAWRIIYTALSALSLQEYPVICANDKWQSNTRNVWYNTNRQKKKKREVKLSPHTLRRHVLEQLCGCTHP